MLLLRICKEQVHTTVDLVRTFFLKTNPLKSCFTCVYLILEKYTKVRWDKSFRHKDRKFGSLEMLRTSLQRSSSLQQNGRRMLGGVGWGLSAKETKSLRVNIIMRKGDKCQILDAKLKVSKLVHKHLQYKFYLVSHRVRHQSN